MTDRFVGIGGNDGNSGLTWALRKLTLNGVEDTPVVAGDDVYVGPGVYREELIVDVDGGNTYSVGTVSVTNGSDQVIGNGTTFDGGNVDAKYEFQLDHIVAEEVDGETYGTSTFTSVADPFQASMVGLLITIVGEGTYRITTFVGTDEITLEDFQALGWPAADTGFTFRVEQWIGPIEIESVDDATTLTLTKPYYGKTLSVLSYLTWNPIRYIADVTGGKTDGVGGVVRITASDDDLTATRGNCIDDDHVSYRTFRGFACDFSTAFAIVIDGANWIVEDCVVSLSTGGVYVLTVDQENITIRRCLFLYHKNAVSIQFTHSIDLDDMGHLIENCSFYTTAWDVINITNVGGGAVKNCTFSGGSDAIDVTAALTPGQMWSASNCLLHKVGSNSFEAAVFGDLVEDYNNVYLCAARSNVHTGANSETHPTFFNVPILLDGFQLPWWWGELGEWSPIKAIAGACEASDDLFGLARPITSAKKSWGAIQFNDAERETGTKRAGAASIALHDAGVHQIFVPVTNIGTTIEVYVYREANYAGTLPRMVIKQPGVADRTTTDVAAASQWNLLTDTFTPDADTDFVVVELQSLNTAVAGNYEVFFDDRSVS